MIDYSTKLYIYSDPCFNKYFLNVSRLFGNLKANFPFITIIHILDNSLDEKNRYDMGESGKILNKKDSELTEGEKENYESKNIY